MKPRDVVRALLTGYDTLLPQGIYVLAVGDKRIGFRGPPSVSHADNNLIVEGTSHKGDEPLRVLCGDRAQVLSRELHSVARWCTVVDGELDGGAVSPVLMIDDYTLRPAPFGSPIFIERRVAAAEMIDELQRNSSFRPKTPLCVHSGLLSSSGSDQLVVAPRAPGMGACEVLSFQAWMARHIPRIKWGQDDATGRWYPRAEDA